MNVSLKNIDAVSALLKVEIEKNDYAEQLDKNLRKMRQKANMPGFRQGMVPLGFVKKLYGKQALLEELNKLVSENMNVYLRDNQVKMLGEPIPNESVQKRIDYDTDENFEYCFDVALSPELDVQISKEDVLTSYEVIVDDEVVDKEIDSYRKNYGSREVGDRIEAEDLVKGTMVELAEGTPKEGGIVVEDAVFIPSYLKGKMEQKKFIHAKVGDKIVFNPYKAHKGAEAELASFLKIEKSAVGTMKSDFCFEVKEISRYKPAEFNQEFFDKIFGADTVTGETDFRDKIKYSLSAQYVSSVDYMLDKDIRDMLIQKADVTFADEILKRWLLLSNEKTTQEEVEKDYPKVITDLKYHLVKEKLVRAYELKVEDEDVENMAKRVLKAQYAQYGVYSVTDEDLDIHVKEMFKKPETVNNLVDRVLDDKLIERVKEQITINREELTPEAFNQLKIKNYELRN